MAPAGGVSQRSRRLVSTATADQREMAPEATGIPANQVVQVAKPAIRPLPVAKPTNQQSVAAQRNGPPSEVADKDDNVQSWLNRQPSSPLSVPSIAKGPTSVRGSTARVQQKQRAQPVVKQLFTSPSKSAQRNRLNRKRVPFKRGRGSGGSSTAQGDSPGTNWRKRLPSISLKATISPAKSIIATASPNILIEVSTEQSPGKWNTVTYRNDIGRPSTSGTWQVATVQDEHDEEHNEDMVIISQENAEELAEPSGNQNIIDECRVPPTVNRKRMSNVLHTNERIVISSQDDAEDLVEPSGNPNIIDESLVPPTVNRKRMSNVVGRNERTVIISQKDAEDLAEPLGNQNIIEECHVRPTVNRKRTTNVLCENSPRVQMVCSNDSQPEFLLVDSDDDGNENGNENGTQENLQPEINNQDQVQPPKPKKSRVDAPRANTRKRLTSKEKWKTNVSKKAFNDGSEYTTSRGTVKQARQIKPPCSGKCNRCERLILPEERLDIFDTFWALEDIAKKRDFLSRLIDEHIPATCNTSSECAKKSIRRYHFVIEEEEIRVCKTMFINTLGIPDVWIETTLKKITPTGLEGDNRGKHRNRPKRIPETTVQSVRDHINLFPRVHSHYTRADTKREYLETHVFSIERMFKMYNQWAQETNIEQPASISAYRNIFNTEFNLGFFLPRKDQCETCARWRTSKPEERREMVSEYAKHLENKRRVKALKAEDKATASDTKCVACFDLQKVLICPRSEVSLFFYHNKLSLYNFTIFDLRLSEGHCNLWTEVDGAKGANEIGTNVLNFIEKKIDEGVKEFVFYSDSPSGQNRNRMIFSMYLHASMKYRIKITHRFLESGHSYSEADGMHGRIETEASIKQEIFTPEEWTDLIKNAKQDGKPYLVNLIKNQDFLNLHVLVRKETWEKDTNNHKVLWSKVREVTADSQTPHTIFYRYNFSDELSQVKVQLKTGSTINHSAYNFPAAYSAKFPLKDKKKKDLRSLMRKGAIPSKYHDTFEQYLSV